ncbi:MULTISPECIES: xanthine permease [unclassified Microbacterium]|uniref:xanthine permease n=1 Tax=unclassified Microbacterium TaxID=2609290 RepID=UPI0012F71963|nr:xanthine permease [Microbacterium sp. MAH-37]MVQ41787.1 xanthine permease [Microbacterium sp. MAH-37]
MTSLAPAPVAVRLKWWKKGDIAAFFALFTNNLTNIITFTALLTMAGLPVGMVVGRIAPAFGLAILITSSMYVWFARRLARKEGRDDVVALPSGPSAPSIFTVTFLVILPVYSSTQDAELAVGIGLVWGFLEGLILFVGSFFGDLLRRAVPRSVLLACLAGLGLLLLAMNPMLQTFQFPVVAFIVLVIVFINWFGRSPFLGKVPTGLLLLIAGTAAAWAFGLQTPEAVQAALVHAGWHPPQVSIGNFFEGLQHAGPFLASAVPLALANYVFDLENIEAAEAAGDHYSARPVMLVNGGATMIGALMGNPYPVTVYIGHTAYKEMGAGIGYTMLNGITMFAVGLFGMSALLLSVVPMAAIAPILIYIGIVTAAQSVRETPKVELPVIFIALFPWIANWANSLIGNTLKAAGTNVAEVGADALNGAGTYFAGISTLGNGAPLSSLLWGMIAIFAIRNKPALGAVVAVLAAILSFFGIIHSPVPSLPAEFALSDTHVMFLVAYLMVAALFLAKWIQDRVTKETVTFTATDELTLSSAVAPSLIQSTRD